MSLLRNLFDPTDIERIIKTPVNLSLADECNEEETVSHIFLECIVVSDVWAAAGVPLGLATMGFTSFLEANIENKYRHHEKVAVIIWSICLRCFVDAALFEVQGLAGYGAIAQNNANQYVRARAGMRICCMDPYLVELWAIKEALSWIKGQGWGSVTIFSDCMNVCSSLNSHVDGRSYAGVITKEGKAIMALLNHVSIKFVARTRNTQAHEFAISTFLYRDSRYWLFEPPTCTFEFPIM
nr:uncharacterized protein LOC109189303 [Ipomoea batatas]